MAGGGSYQAFDVEGLVRILTGQAEDSLRVIAGKAKETADDAGKAFDDLNKKIGFEQAAHQFERLAGAGVGMLKSIVDEASSMEGFRTKLVTVLKDTDAADAALRKYVDFAAKTPFQVKGVVDAAVQLNIYRQNVEEILPLAGDLAAAMGTDITDSATALGKALSGSQEGIRQLTQSFGVSRQALKEHGVAMNSMGEISVRTTADLAKFQKAVKEIVGEFAGGGMERMSQTFKGAFSNLEDSVSKLKASLGAALLPVLTPLVKGMTDFIETLNNMDPGLKGAIAGALVAGTAILTVVSGFALARIAVIQLAGALPLLTGAFGATGTAAKAASAGIGASGVAAASALGPILAIGTMAISAAEMYVKADEMRRAADEKAVVATAQHQNALQNFLHIQRETHIGAGTGANEVSAFGKQGVGLKELGGALDEVKEKLKSFSNVDEYKKVQGMIDALNEKGVKLPTVTGGKARGPVGADDTEEQSFLRRLIDMRTELNKTIEGGIQGGERARTAAEAQKKTLEGLIKTINDENKARLSAAEAAELQKQRMEQTKFEYESGTASQADYTNELMRYADALAGVTGKEEERRKALLELRKTGYDKGFMSGWQHVEGSDEADSRLAGQDRRDAQIRSREIANRKTANDDLKANASLAEAITRDSLSKAETKLNTETALLKDALDNREISQEEHNARVGTLTEEYIEKVQDAQKAAAQTQMEIDLGKTKDVDEQAKIRRDFEIAALDNIVMSQEERTKKRELIEQNYTNFLRDEKTKRNDVDTATEQQSWRQQQIQITQRHTAQVEATKSLQEQVFNMTATGPQKEVEAVRKKVNELRGLGVEEVEIARYVAAEKDRIRKEHEKKDGDKSVFTGGGMSIQDAFGGQGVGGKLSMTGGTGIFAPGQQGDGYDVDAAMRGIDSVAAGGISDAAWEQNTQDPAFTVTNGVSNYAPGKGPGGTAEASSNKQDSMIKQVEHTVTLNVTIDGEVAMSGDGDLSDTTVNGLLSDIDFTDHILGQSDTRNGRA